MKRYLLETCKRISLTVTDKVKTIIIAIPIFNKDFNNKVIIIIIPKSYKLIKINKLQIKSIIKTNKLIYNYHHHSIIQKSIKSK